jgi:hypothetical protein
MLHFASDFLARPLRCSVHNVFCMSAYKLINLMLALSGETPLGGVSIT